MAKVETLFAEVLMLFKNIFKIRLAIYNHVSVQNLVPRLLYLHINNVGISMSAL